MKRFLIFFSLCDCFLAAAFAAPKPVPPPPAGNRFLFVVDTSAAMYRFEYAGRQALFDLIYSGIDGQMQAGDTFGVWTFGDDVRAGIFPMQIWNPEQKLELASRAGMFLKSHRYGSRACLDRAVTNALALVRTIKEVNVFFISDGRTQFEGTSFAGDINAAYKTNLTGWPKSKKPLVTTLTARKGEIVSWSVTRAGDQIDLPEKTPLYASKTAGQTAPGLPSKPATTNDPVAQGLPSPIVGPPGTPAATAASPQTPPRNVIVIKRPTPKQPPVLSDLPNPSAQTPLVLTGPVSSPPSSTAPDILAPSSISSLLATEEPGAPTLVKETTGDLSNISAIALPERAVSSSSESPGSWDEIRPAAASPAASLPFPMPVMAREKTDLTNSPSPAGLTAMATPPKPFLGPRQMSFIGIGLLAVALGLLIITARRSRSSPQSSFISRSLDRHN
jgi:hypothetical protein